MARVPGRQSSLPPLHHSTTTRCWPSVGHVPYLGWCVLKIVPCHVCVPQPNFQPPPGSKAGCARYLDHRPSSEPT
ncbi:hypothetical protein CH063_15671, partial [Colletotrichum higginsianum]